MYQDNKLFLFILISLLIITVTNSGYIPLQSHTINYGYIVNKEEDREIYTEFISNITTV